ncbi:hypothetical protein [Streptomyces flaveus]|nr:hypothetical protein [Streptomyces flaveus]
MLGSTTAHRPLAPRLHYYDGACTDHGIYVGYMGPHLTNTMT